MWAMDPVLAAFASVISVKDIEETLADHGRNIDVSELLKKSVKDK
jgi:hypothetical protein